MCGPGEVQGHAIPAFQQRGPSRKGLFCYGRALNPRCPGHGYHYVLFH